MINSSTAMDGQGALIFVHRFILIANQPKAKFLNETFLSWQAWLLPWWLRPHDEMTAPRVTCLLRFCKIPALPLIKLNMRLYFIFCGTGLALSKFLQWFRSNSSSRKYDGALCTEVSGYNTVPRNPFLVSFYFTYLYIHKLELKRSTRALYKKLQVFSTSRSCL